MRWEFLWFWCHRTRHPLFVLLGCHLSGKRCHLSIIHMVLVVEPGGSILIHVPSSFSLWQQHRQHSHQPWCSIIPNRPASTGPVGLIRPHPFLEPSLYSSLTHFAFQQWCYPSHDESILFGSSHAALCGSF